MRHLILLKTDRYSTGLYWSKKELTQSIDEIIDLRIKMNLPAVLIIDGGQGQGKNTLAVHIMDYINSRYNLPPVQLELKEHIQIALGGEEFISNFSKAIKLGLPCIQYDEAGDYNKGSSLSYFNYQITKIFQKIRSGNMIILMTLPNLNVLDNRLFMDEIIRGSLHLHGRMKTKKWGNIKVYDSQMTDWIRYHFGNLPAPLKHLCYNNVVPLFECIFKDLPKDRARKLKLLSDEGKAKERLKSELQLKGLVSVNEISQKVNRSIIWIRQYIYKHKIKSTLTSNRVKYYHKSYIDQINNHIVEKGFKV